MQFIKSASLVSIVVLAAAAVACSSGGGTTPTTDAGPTDAKADKVTPPPTDGSTAKCEPQSASGFSPSATTPAATAAGACTAKDVDDFFTFCIDPGDTTKCTALQKDTTKANCLKCLITPQSAAKWGALIQDDNNLIFNNIAGCLSVKGDTACADASSQSSACSRFVCPDTVCPVPSGDKTALNALNTCLSNASKSACKTYADKANACLGADTGSVAACTGADFKGTYTAVATVICVNGK